LGGGELPIISPPGKLLGGIPLSIYNHSPFNDFLIPEITLFLVLGLSSCLLIFALNKKPINILAEYFNFFKDM